MNWNPYKRIAALEHKVANLHKWAVALEDRLHETNQRLNPYAAAPVRSEGAPVFTKAEVADAAEQKRIKQREYQRAYYAKQRAKAKQNEYQRAYRARKKAATQALGGTA